MTFEVDLRCSPNDRSSLLSRWWLQPTSWPLPLLSCVLPADSVSSRSYRIPVCTEKAVRQRYSDKSLFSSATGAMASGEPETDQSLRQGSKLKQSLAQKGNDPADRGDGQKVLSRVAQLPQECGTLRESPSYPSPPFPCPEFGNYEVDVLGREDREALGDRRFLNFKPRSNWNMARERKTSFTRKLEKVISTTFTSLLHSYSSRCLQPWKR